ncbi:type-5 uracil-DNA glycosylase [soil metagenome]|nr:uracil-DNA glycosylase [Trueperaceae bacterium]
MSAGAARALPPGGAFDPFPEALSGCRRCARLAHHREEVGRTKRRAYAGETYWARPVPGVGDPAARLLLLGLAPGAHGSNRTGRMFTGDASGDFLFPALHRAGLADRPESRHRGDGLELRGVWITAAARCAPPGNRPTPDEIATCRSWLEHDLAGLPALRAVLALGRIAHDAYLDLLRARGLAVVKARLPFAHGAFHPLDRLPGAGAARALPLLDTFHVSRQNTNTGKLTAAMFDEVLARAATLAGVRAS